MDLKRGSTSCGSARHYEMPGSDIQMTGYLKKMKLKTMKLKKKYFVLRSTSSSGPARLEYHDMEKNYNSGRQPKRIIHLHTCFNINRKSDSRHKHAIALYTREECFSVVCEDEKEQEKWLDLMLKYQNEFLMEGERGREHYDFVWQVTIQPKGLGQTMNIRGPYRLCLNGHSIFLFKLNTDKPHYVFQLETVRSVGHQDNMFKLVVGKISPTGEGELLMHSDDAVITQNIHETILDFMKNMDRRQDSYDNRRSFSESLHSSVSSLPRPPPEFRHRSETFTQGSNRTRPRVERLTSVGARTTRSTSHLHCAVSPGSSPHSHGFMEHQIMGSHRFRSNSNDSKASRASFSAAMDDLMHDHHSLSVMRPALQEESDLDVSLGLDQSSGLTSPDSQLLDLDEADGQGGESYMEMNPAADMPPTPSKNGYMDMAPIPHKGADSKEGWSDQGSTYMQMMSTRSSSAPIPIHPGYGEQGYMEMTSHSMLPPVKEGGSGEGYVPMSAPYSSSSYVSDSSQLKPDRVKCMLSDDGSDFSQPPLRTYSLGSRPVKSGTAVNSGYVDMSGSKKVSDNGRCCSAPHLVHPQVHRSGRTSNMDSPTPSASPLSMSLKSDDSDAFMELDFYRPRTASDSYSYRPHSSTFGMPHSSLAQGHRPRSSSHGQGTRPLRRNKMLAECMGRLNHEAVLRSHNASHSSVDSLKVSSSESLKKLSQEIRSKTSQLNNSGYMDMSGEKRFTPSPQPSPAANNQSEHGGYVDMTLGKQDSYVDMTLGSHRPVAGFKPSVPKASGCDKSQEFDSPNTSLVSSTPGRDSVYMNFDSPDGMKNKESASCSSPSQSAEAYIMYEPAAPTTSAAGKENVPDSPSSIPKDRSSSGKEGKKRGGFFSLRHSQGDSGKHGPKRSESTQQNSSFLYSSTGGQQFGSLGRDFRKKSKDLSKAARQKSSSFSKTFGISTSKPGKLLRKTPTPPSSLDGNDEYIEFIPTSAKSDRDSSHSSGSIKAAHAKPEAPAAKEEAVYVGYEPGNLSASSSACSQRVPASSLTSSYLPMNVGGSGQSKVFTVIKPVKKSGVKEHQSKEECSPVVVAQPPTCVSASQFGTVVYSQRPTAGPTPLGHAAPGQPAPADLPSSVSKSSQVRPPAVCPEQSQSGVCRKEDPVLKSDPACSAQSFGCDPQPTASPVVKDPVSVLSKTQSCPNAAAPCSAGRSELSDGVQLVAHSGLQSSEVHSPMTRCSLSESSMCSPPASAESGLSTNPSSASCCCALTSTPIASHQASVSALLKSGPSPVSAPASDGGYMHFDPAQSALATPPAVDTNITEVMPAVVTSCITSGPSGSGPKEPVVTQCVHLAATSPTASPAPSSLSGRASGSSEVQRVAGSSSSAFPPGRKGSGTENRSASSGSKASTAGLKTAVECSSVMCAKSSGEKLCAGGSGTAEASTGDGESCHTGTGDKMDSPGDFFATSPQSGLMRLDSGPCTASGSGGRGRGRHFSSSSVGVTQPVTGKSGDSNSSVAGGPDPGLMPINMGADTRRSISDLSGCQQMAFPSNALSKQQPNHSAGPAPQLQPSGQGSGSTGSSQGGLNYAKLDLSSADSVGDCGEGVKSPRNRSRHSSVVDEKMGPLSYATIDFEKSESLRSSASKDVKLIL